jgi:hypothetical protein
MQPNFQTYQQQQQYQSKHDFQNPYFRFMYQLNRLKPKKDIRTDLRHFWHVIYSIMSQLEAGIIICFTQWMIQLFRVIVDGNVFTIWPTSYRY